MTTPAQSRRRALLALLDQYPMERELYLYEGRRAAPPRDEFADKIESLFADATLLNRLWASSTGLLDRFNAQPSVKQAADRMMSEVLELVIAAHDTYGASTDDAAEEAADVVVTAINVLRAACVTQEQFTAALETIIAKNDKKSHDDYELIVKTQGVEKRAKMENQS